MRELIHEGEVADIAGLDTVVLESAWKLLVAAQDKYHVTKECMAVARERLQAAPFFFLCSTGASQRCFHPSLEVPRGGPLSLLR